MMQVGHLWLQLINIQSKKLPCTLPLQQPHHLQRRCGDTQVSSRGHCSYVAAFVTEQLPSVWCRSTCPGCKHLPDQQLCCHLTSRLPPERACIAIFSNANADMRTLQQQQQVQQVQHVRKSWSSLSCLVPTWHKLDVSGWLSAPYTTPAACTPTVQCRHPASNWLLIKGACLCTGSAGGATPTKTCRCGLDDQLCSTHAEHMFWLLTA
jgi:hypothetical protein